MYVWAGEVDVIDCSASFAEEMMVHAVVDVVSEF